MLSTDQLNVPAPHAAFDSEAARLWLSRLHGADSQGKFRHPIELRVLWLDRVVAPINRCFRDAKSLAEFASQYGSRDSGANLYTGVASRRDPNAPGDSSNLAEALELGSTSMLSRLAGMSRRRWRWSGSYMSKSPTLFTRQPSSIPVGGFTFIGNSPSLWT